MLSYSSVRKAKGKIRWKGKNVEVIPKSYTAVTHSSSHASQTLTVADTPTPFTNLATSPFTKPSSRKQTIHQPFPYSPAPLPTHYLANNPFTNPFIIHFTFTKQSSSQQYLHLPFPSTPVPSPTLPLSTSLITNPYPLNQFHHQPLPSQPASSPTITLSTSIFTNPYPLCLSSHPLLLPVSLLSLTSCT